MNIVLEDNNLRMVNHNQDESYDLDSLIFYIPIEYKDIAPYLIIKQDSITDVVRLKKITGTNKSYDSYVCDLTPIKVKSGGCQISLLLLTLETERANFVIGTPFVLLNLNIENYSFKYQIYFVESLSRTVSSTYEKIVNLYNQIIDITKMTIEMISDQEKGG